MSSSCLGRRPRNSEQFSAASHFEQACRGASGIIRDRKPPSNRKKCKQCVTLSFVSRLGLLKADSHDMGVYENSGPL